MFEKIKIHVVRLSLIFSLIISTTLGLVAQDPVFTQFYLSPLQLNPALTGTVDAPVFHLNYRNQWPQMSKAYVTYAASYNQFFSKFNSGLGVSILSDVAGNGIYNSNQFGLSYAYEVRMSDDLYFRTGLEANYVNKRLNWDKLIFFDQLDIETGPINSSGGLNQTAENRPSESINYFDFGFGVLMHSRYFYGGVSMKHINAPRDGFFRNNNSPELPLRLTVHAGTEIPLNVNNKYKSSSFLSPAVMFTKQRQFYQLNLGSNIQYESLLGGLWFRHTFGNSDAIIVLAGYEMKFFKIVYSYDLTVSKLGTNTGGAHEISLIFNFENKKKYQYYNNCLKLFR